MKSKEGLSIIIRDLETNPQCKHGPTILFSQRNKLFFACATDRSFCYYLEHEKFEMSRNKDKILEATSCSKKEYLIDTKLVNQQIYCLTCNEFSRSIKHHETHSFKTITSDFLKQPSLFLPQLDNDKVNAQYFFDETSLTFLASIFESLGLNKIICIGTPRLHDFLRNHDEKFKPFLMDIDERYKPFYPDEFCHYNMFNHYFFNGCDDEKRLEKFIQLDSADDNANSHHCLITDPPFAARTELVTQTIKTISSAYFRLNRKLLPIFWIFPYFNEPHIKKVMPEMEMLDYQVTYVNHSHFKESYKGRKEGSPIRIFTNIDQRFIKYPAELKNYRYCDVCQRFVAATNEHCFVCKICPSKNGSTYRHCNDCEKCVKPNYVHCSACDRCVQSTTHECKSYQLISECWLCGKRGHVEKHCSQMKRFKRKKKNGTCGLCVDNARHNLSVCPSKQNFIKIQFKTNELN